MKEKSFKDKFFERLILFLFMFHFLLGILWFVYMYMTDSRCL